METYINQKVIIRADRAGVFFGTLAGKDGTEVRLTEVRRIWYWEGACSLSEMAVSGVTNPRSCKFTVTVPEMVITGVIEIIPCTGEAVANIENVPVWRSRK